MYKLTSNPDCILDESTNSFIPRGHALWAKYEEWLASGNKPDDSGVDFLRAFEDKIYELHSLVIQTIIGASSIIERDTWYLKLAAAESIKAGAVLSVSCAAFLGAAGIESDEDKEVWADSVLQKSVQYAHVCGGAEKIKREYLKKLYLSDSDKYTNIVSDCKDVFDLFLKEMGK